MYTPNYYNPMYQQPQMQQPVQQPSPGIVWVQGEAGAKSYLVAPNQTVLLMDSEEQRFYIKTSDPSGIPMPLRSFKYEELSAAPQAETGSFVTRKEFNELISRLKLSEVTGNE